LVLIEPDDIAEGLVEPLEQGGHTKGDLAAFLADVQRFIAAGTDLPVPAGDTRWPPFPEPLCGVIAYASPRTRGLALFALDVLLRINPGFFVPAFILSGIVW